MSTFADFKLSKTLVEALNSQKITTPTPIQEAAIPLLLDLENDFVGQAQTGTGKTLAFLLPLITRIDLDSEDIQALIMLPTRELAKQVEEQIRKITQFERRLQSVVIYGGESYDKQVSQIRSRRPQIVVGTPGRIIDLMDRRVLNFKNVTHLLLDEADEMLKMGFIDDINHIIDSLSENHSSWMFSATMPREIERLINDKFRNPHFEAVKSTSLSSETIEQHFFLVPRGSRREALHRLIVSDSELFAIIFCKTKADTKEVSSFLIDRGIPAEVLNGDMAQAQREMSLQRFKNKKVNFIICTDVAARGIDISNISHVINYGLPQEYEAYVHRIGRTGRAGATGISWTIIEPNERSGVRQISRMLNADIKESQLPTVDDLKKKLIERELERLMPILTQLQEKQEQFKLDPMFKLFEDSFNEVDSETLKKVLFTFIFNKDFKRLSQMGELALPPRQPSSNYRGGGRDGRDSRGGGRDNHRSGGGYRGGHGGGSGRSSSSDERRREWRAPRDDQGGSRERFERPLRTGNSDRYNDYRHQDDRPAPRREREDSYTPRAKPSDDRPAPRSENKDSRRPFRD